MLFLATAGKNTVLFTQLNELERVTDAVRTG